MKRMRLLSLLLALCLIVSLFAGCKPAAAPAEEPQPDNAAEEPAEKPAEEPAEDGKIDAAALGDVTIEGLIWAAEDIEGAELLYQDFMETYPNITFEYSFMTLGSQQELTPRMAAGTFPNFVTMNGGAFASELCAAGWLADVSDTDAYNKMFDSLQKAFYDPTTDIAFGATCAQGVLVTWLNMDIFNAAGAKVPTNYDEFLAACEKIKAAGYTPVIEGPANDYSMSFLAGGTAMAQAHDATAYDSIVAGTFDYSNSDDVKTAYQRILDVYKAGYLQDGAMDTSYDAAVAAFCNGDAAMYMQGSWLASSCLSEDLPFESDVTLQPFNAAGESQYAVTLPEDGFAVGAKATEEQIAASKLLLEFYLGDGYTYFQGRRGCIPSMAAEDYPTEVTMSDKLVKFVDAKNAVPSYFHHLNFFPSAVYSDYRDLTFAVMNGSMTPQDAADTLQSLQ